jgi:hypothetical protein
MRVRRALEKPRGIRDWSRLVGPAHCVEGLKLGSGDGEDI